MTKYLILDAETNGLPDYSRPAEEAPRVAGVTMIVFNDDDEPASIAVALDTLIKPDGWTISEEITAINGLTTERCEAEGRPIAEVLAIYSEMIVAGYILTTYNAQFDAKVMRGELRRAAMDDFFEKTPNICLMRACHPIGIKKANGKKGYPGLADAWAHFLPGVDQPKPHTSSGDARAALEIFINLKVSGNLPEPAVHHAKEGSKSHDALMARKEKSDV